MNPAKRETWLQRACGDDESHRAEVARLSNQEEGADSEGGGSFTESMSTYLDTTANWIPRGDNRRSHGDRQVEHGGALADRFAPQPAIAFVAHSQPSFESRPVLQQRLFGLTIVCMLMVGMTLFWKSVVLWEPDANDLIPYTIVLLVQGGIAIYLSRARPVSSSVLKVLELGVMGLVAAAFAFTQYQGMLHLSLHGDPLRAQHVLNHRVHVAAVLILSYGIYAPKGRWHTALVVGPLAILPSAVLLALFLRYPQAMWWLVRVTTAHGSSPLEVFGLDVLVLLMLAVVSASGAHTISRLRRQVKEARQYGQYHLLRRLGAGGMGEVYLAEHQLLKRPCALKLIRPGIESGLDALARFEREVRLTATLSHPNTVEIYDYGRTEDGTYYYVMEYLQGLSLAELVEQYGPLPPGRVVYLLRQVCGALLEAHAAGLIHRDIKPSNIFASRRGGLYDVAKLFDFGLVRPLTRSVSSQVSTEGQVLGTPLFMSPEQAERDRVIDGRSDIYSLGGVAYYLLTGRPPFDEEEGLRLMIAIARDPVVPPSQVHSGIPRDLERVVLRCLAKDATERFPDAESLERALGECVCTAEWNQDHAARWWRSRGSVHSS